MGDASVPVRSGMNSELPLMWPESRENMAGWDLGGLLQPGGLHIGTGRGAVPMGNMERWHWGGGAGDLRGLL